MTECALVQTVDVSLWLPNGRRILDAISWVVRPGETWALMGPNGAGKTTLLSVISSQRFPSSGQVRVLGHQLGRVDVWKLRRQLGVVDQGLRMPPELTVEEIVLTGKTGSVYPMWGRYDAEDRNRAVELLELFRCQALAARSPRHLSQGERGRVRIARALMAKPSILVLDEPATGLDMVAREQLLRALSDLRATNPALGVVLVSHQVEELPSSTSHALLLREGSCVSQGEVATALTSATLSACFAGEIELTRDTGRWQARLAETSTGLRA